MPPPPVLWHEYLADTTAALTRLRYEVQCLPENIPAATLCRRIATASWRLSRYSLESEAGTENTCAAAMIQGEWYRQSLFDATEMALALYNADRLESLLQIANALCDLATECVPTFPDVLNAYHIEITEE